MTWIVLLCSLSSVLWAQIDETKIKAPNNPIGTIKNWSSPESIKPPQVKLEVTKFKLPNGLTVLLHEDHTVPMISYHTWYRVGSKDEKPGVTGAAHMLEHMMFKGAKKYTGKDFDRILHENGITNNAFTSYDYTGFYENLPSNKLELMMDVEVDRMRSLALRPEDLKSEREVVKEERRYRTDNNPTGLLREAMMGAIFKLSPYRWPVIGYMKDISDFDVNKLKFFYDTYYVPNNAVLVLSGDFDTHKTRKLIEKYYGVLESKPLAERKYAQESNLMSPQNIKLTKDVQNTTLIVSFKTPKAGTREAYALDLASQILGGGASSRLHKRLIFETQLASQVRSYNMTLQEVSLFEVHASLKPGASLSKTLEVINKELWQLRNRNVTDAELQKAKNQVMKDFVDGLTTLDGRAQALAINEIVFGDYTQLYKDLELYNQVTVEDVKKATSKYLTPQRRNTAILDPKG